MNGPRFWVVYATAALFSAAIVLLLIALIGAITQPREQHCMSAHNESRTETRCIQR